MHPEMKALVTKVLRPFLLPVACFERMQPIHFRCLEDILGVHSLIIIIICVFLSVCLCGPVAQKP
jgi:hypothetical protein